MTFALLAGPQTIATGRLAEILAAGEARGLVVVERFEARRTGDEVERRRLVPGVMIVIVPAAERRAAA
jgi:hypothetical protein